MTQVKIANRNARSYVQERKPFSGSNLFAVIQDGRYIVYSYGSHHVLYVAECSPDGSVTWFENETAPSRTTAKHRTQSHPHTTTTMMNHWAMQSIAELGFVEALARGHI